MSRYIVTGTDTGIGKTLVAAALCAHLQATYWKPVQAGTDEETDSTTVARLSGLPPAMILPEAYRLATPCSPHEAARLDGVTIDPTRLALPTVDGPLIIEGAGGVLVPLASDLLYADMFKRWGLPVILVARTQLGTINHSLLALEALRARGIAAHGVLFSGDANLSSEATICISGKARHLGRLPLLDKVDAPRLHSAFAASVRTDLL